MAVFFIDYENVNSAGVVGVEKLGPDNVVHIFYSVKADTIKIEEVIELMKADAKIEFHDATMRGQKNALDFELIAMLYYTKKEDETCYIISKDAGYDAAITFGRRVGANHVYRKPSILEACRNGGGIDLKDPDFATGGRRQRSHASHAEEFDADYVADDSGFEGDFGGAAAQAGKAAQEAEQEVAAGADNTHRENPEDWSMPGEVNPDDLMPHSIFDPAGNVSRFSGADGEKDPFEGLDDEKADEMLRSKTEEKLKRMSSSLDMLGSSFGSLFDFDGDGASDEKDERGEDETAKKEPDSRHGKPASEDTPETAPVKDESEKDAAGEDTKAELANVKSEKAELAKLAEPLQIGPAAAGKDAQKPQKEKAEADKTSKEKAETDKTSKEKAESTPAKRRSSRGRKKESEENAPKVRIDPQYKSKIVKAMKAAGFSLTDEDYNHICEALQTTSNKNQFYQFFRKKRGEIEGRKFYLSIRGQYANLITIK